MKYLMYEISDVTSQKVQITDNMKVVPKRDRKEINLVIDRQVRDRIILSNNICKLPNREKENEKRGRKRLETETRERGKTEDKRKARKRDNKGSVALNGGICPRKR